ncbi:Uncharacterized membrane protein [Methanobrevibacter olleyae]|uniref:Uncharacterized membrane protein n=1 Tax=Methanobrevibacter olleyae TaxID=294671 RepID=A0A1I4KWJ7_METOL|nr:DUF63 family protein [Methanobrevibacter olleyae]SFL82993.1 Uncharacterized membrane protein [Methanobrevibacter olleyae]
MATVDTFIPDIIQTTFFSGYTIFNTVVYTLVLLIFILAIIKMFKKLEIDPLSIFFSIVPFIFLGCSIRALVDNGVYPKTVFLITPGLYILVGLLTILSFLFSVFLFNKKGIDYRYTLFYIGLLFLLPNIILFSNLNFTAIFYIFITWIFVSLIFIIISLLVLYIVNYNRYSNFYLVLEKIINYKINFSIVLAHLFDASTTFVALEYFNYSEQHVLPNALNQLFDTYITIFPMKIIVIVAVLYIIDRYFEDTTVKNLLKLTVFVLGLAPGLRNILTLAIATI